MVSLCTLDCTQFVWPLNLQITPESGTAVAAAMGGTVRNRKVLAGTHCDVHVHSAAHSQPLLTAGTAGRTQLTSMGIEVEEGNGTLIPG